MGRTALTAVFGGLLAAGLGTELRTDGYALKPPESFRLQRGDLFEGSRLGSLGLGGGRWSALLVDGEGPSAAAMVIAWADGSFSAHPSDRDELAGQVLHHFTDELGVPATLQTAEWVQGAIPRIEVLGTLRQQGQVRYLLVAALPGEGRHPVVAFSIPSARLDALLPQLKACLDTFHVESPAARPLWRNVAGAVAGALAGALLVSVALWRRRRQRRERPSLTIP
jgi:hypothetical protein